MSDNPVDNFKVQSFTNLGEITVGGTSDPLRVVLIALANLNNPEVNEVLQAFQVKFVDRFTSTNVFPRDGMALPNGAVYKTPVGENISLSAATILESK